MMDEKILSSAFTFLTRKPYSIGEMQEKLEKKFIKPKTENIQETKNNIEEVINYLKENKYLDDTNFAEIFIEHQKNISPKGSFVIRQKLKEKKVSDQIINSSLEKFLPQTEEKHLAEEIAKRKILSLATTLEYQKKYEKLFRFLVTRGFSFEVSKTVLEKVLPKI